MKIEFKRSFARDLITQQLDEVEMRWLELQGD